jgi:hypothetical protein
MTFSVSAQPDPNSRPGIDDLLTVDLMIDPKGEDLPEAQLNEKVIHHLVAMTHAQQARDAIEPQDAEAAAMVNPPRDESVG